MNHLWKDVQYGVRMLASQPGFTLAAVLVLALGIGANSAVFSLINAFLLKPIAVQKPGELAGLYSRDTKRSDLRGWGRTSHRPAPLLPHGPRRSKRATTSSARTIFKRWRFPYCAGEPLRPW